MKFWDDTKTDDVYLDTREILITPKAIGSITYALLYLEFIEVIINGRLTVLKTDSNDKKKVITGLFI